MGYIQEGFESAVINLCQRFGRWIFNGILYGSYWICLLICMLSLIAYIVGYRKFGKYIGISIVVHAIFQAIQRAIS